MDHAENFALTSADNKPCPALHKACAVGIIVRDSQLPFTALWLIRRRKTDSLENQQQKNKQTNKKQWRKAVNTIIEKHENNND